MQKQECSILKVRTAQKKLSIDSQQLKRSINYNKTTNKLINSGLIFTGIFN